MSIELLGPARTEKELGKARGEILHLRQQLNNWQMIAVQLRQQLKRWVDMFTPNEQPGTQGAVLLADTRRFLAPIPDLSPEDEQKDVYWNNGEEPIIIVSKFRVDPEGGPAIPESQCIIAPGEGVDLSLIGLSRRKS